MHPEAKAFLKRVAKKASEIRRIDEEVLFKYFLNRLSVTLVRGVAHAIIQRGAKVNSHSSIESDPGYLADVVTSA